MVAAYRDLKTFVIAGSEPGETRDVDLGKEAIVRAEDAELLRQPEIGAAGLCICFATVIGVPALQCRQSGEGVLPCCGPAIKAVVVSRVEWVYTRRGKYRRIQRIG